MSDTTFFESSQAKLWARAENAVARRRLARRCKSADPASIRIPVTAANRALLRDLRARELADWKWAARWESPAERFGPAQPAPAEDPVARRLFLLLALAALGALVQHGSAVLSFFQGWGEFSGWIAGLLR